MSAAGDGIDDAFEELFRHGMVLSSQIGREVSRVWEHLLRNKATLSEREATRLQLAFDTEKRTALSVLKPTSQKAWWDQAKPSEVAEAYRIATAWSAHDPAAADAAKVIQEQAAARFGLDEDALSRLAPEAVAGAAVPALMEKQQRAADLVHTKAYFAQANPERLSKYEAEVRYSDSAEDTVTEQKLLIKEWRAATGQNAEAAADLGAVVSEAKTVRGQAHGLEEVAAAEFVDAREGRVEAEKALAQGPSPAEEAWYRDTFLAESPEIDQAYENSANAASAARKDDTAGTRRLGQAEAAHLAADRQEELVARLRAGVGGEEGVAALEFAQGQQKFPIAHAAAGKGRTVNKVKANAPQKTAAKGKLISR
ncbi:hypothetical protein AL755_03595 (plasmid) [Arthrobacter sp. ERGS1:01]|uniref:hypothetical protein n=1 Tax=Arthrobacter sp. ERGS1:01 TaxID=1704044 RepID=UPI0006B52253|nr:hypothetical protein [Arthrobacter sp. ERGS1:01]ALE04781.1 hypothetical protein AL755_03595 [Arthrobacter sp. ERGS1:01]